MFHGFLGVEKNKHQELEEFHLPEFVSQIIQLLLNCTVKAQV